MWEIKQESWRPRTSDIYSGDHGKKLRVAKKLLLLFK